MCKKNIQEIYGVIQLGSARGNGTPLLIDLSAICYVLHMVITL